MRYKNVFLNSLGYVLPEEVMSTQQLESRLAEVYDLFNIEHGQLEAMTKIKNRRFWPKDSNLVNSIGDAARQALSKANLNKQTIGMLVCCSVYRENLEPANACAIANELELSSNTVLFDISNACLGAINGLFQVANAIELEQIQAGMVVCAESSREIIECMIEEILEEKNLHHFSRSISTLTGGSAAIAIVLSHREMRNNGHRLLGGVVSNDSKCHHLCEWKGIFKNTGRRAMTMQTDALAVLNHGVNLSVKTYADFLKNLQWQTTGPDKFICHQVGYANQRAVREALGWSEEKEFTTYQELGNTGTVSLPITLAIAEQSGFINKGDRIALLGIGSGLNCMMAGITW